MMLNQSFTPSLSQFDKLKSSSDGGISDPKLKDPILNLTIILAL